MNILFIIPYPLGKAPSQRFRFEQYFRILDSQGIKYEAVPFLDNATWGILYESGNLLRKALAVSSGFIRRLKSLFILGKYEFIFIHREAGPIGPPVFEYLYAKVFRKKIIYDFDDAIWLPNTSDENKLIGKLKWPGKVSLICKWSYKVSCGNEYLCNYARQFNKNVILNPTTIDTENQHNPYLYVKSQLATNKKIRLGWTGSHSTLKYLEEIIPVLKKLEKQIAFDFLVISNKRPEFQLKSLRFIPWNQETEIEDLMKIDIGLMPLSQDPWVLGKCGFKALQYMALEKPALVTPVGVNKEIVENGISGLHCWSEEEWLESIGLLIEDQNRRKILGKAARGKIENYYSVTSNAPNFLSLFT
ncbi:MAG: glycosyltransferase family 4 protein [Cyclobacteriaceae bacterium]